MSTLRALQNEGRLDDAGAQLLYKTVRSIAYRGGFPPPEGYSRWDEEAITTSAHEFLTGPRSIARLVSLAAQAPDDTSFERLLRKSVLNFFRDEARRTVIGRQIRRLKEVAASDDTLIVGESVVARDDISGEVYSGDEYVLLRAALRLDVSRRRWRPDAGREGPVADRDGALTLIHTVLSTAKSPVLWATMARVVARRFALEPLPVTVEVDVLEPRWRQGYARVEVEDQVDAVLEQLTDRERQVLPYLDMSSREAAELLPYGHSTVAATQRRVKDLLATLLTETSADAAILATLVERIEAQRRHGEHDA